jgi:VWFA-related protein
MTRGLVRTVAALFLCAQAVGAQQAPPTFHSGVQAVQLDVSVIDSTGKPVRDLTKADFEILEDGKPQAITAFSLVNIPIETPQPYSATAPEPDVATNTAGEGRLYVIVFDEVVPIAQTLGGDAASGTLYLKARQFLHTFIEQHFQSNDVGLVVSVGQARSGDMQDFTSSRRLLLNAIDTYGGFPDAMTPANPLKGQDGLNADAPIRPAGAPAIVVQTGRQIRDPLNEDIVPGSIAAAQRSQARALRSLMEALEAIRGRRKAVIYVTNQVDNVWSVIDYNGGARSLEFDDLHAAMTAAMRGGVAFYVFDPTGLDSLGTGSSTGDLERVDNLRKLSDATGGFAVLNSNEFDRAFARVVSENSTYYVLGFTSTNDRRDGRYRRVEVRTKRPGLTVRARDGYIAPSKNERTTRDVFEGVTLASGVREAVRTPLANRSVPMSVFATALRGSGREANVVIAVEIDPMRLGLSTSPTGQIELATAAISAAGKVERAQRERFTLNLEPNVWSQAKGGVRFLTGLTLPPGRYQLRVAGGNIANSAAGSVMYDLTVPDFGQTSLAMSAPSLSSRDARGFTLPLKTVRADLPHIPITTREFTTGDRLSVYTEFYDGERRESHQLVVEAHLRTMDGTQVVAVMDVRKSGPAVHKFEALIPIDVPPGAYTLHVEARSTLAKQPPVSRDIPLRVR